MALTTQYEIAVLGESANHFERMGNAAADAKEQADMYLVARSIRNAAAYAVAAGHARSHRAEMERRSAIAAGIRIANRTPNHRINRAHH